MSSDGILFEVEMANSALEFLLKNLNFLVEHNANLIRESKDQIETLVKNLSLFKAFIKELQKRRRKSRLIQEVVKQIRDVVYEEEDVVDTFVSQPAVQEERSMSKKVMRVFSHSGKSPRNTGTQIKLISEKVKRIYESFDFDSLRDLDRAASTASTKLMKAPTVEQDCVVGFEGEVTRVTSLLTGGPDDLEVISIVGMAGIGKTTLAKIIYHRAIEFKTQIWVYVSQEYSRKEVFLSISRHLGVQTDEMYNMPDEDIANKLRACLEKENYLIVMDDVWTTKAWDDLEIAFPRNKTRSRILLTTRVESVARHANPMIEPHRLRRLNDEESLSLLIQKAHGMKQCPAELLPYGKRIADQCSGLPLALVLIGGILLEKGTESYVWEKVASSMDVYTFMDNEKIWENVIQPSFIQLPPQLKECFLYLGMFPKGFLIPAWKLSLLWIAEGFIPQIEGRNVEDTAAEYLDNLVSRNLVMVEERKYNGKIRTCVVHDMLHGFCRTQAAQGNFFHEIKQSDQATYSSSNPAFEKYRRLCMHFGVSNFLSSKPFGTRVRSFLSFSSEEIILEGDDVSSIREAFKLLRVLDAKPISFTHFPDDLTQLIHLRYLVLYGNITILPVALSSLWNLQSLIVETSSGSLEIKGDIWKMIQLRHVKANASTSLPAPLAKLENKETDSSISANLQTISTISPESCTQDVFDRAPNLKKLGIRGKLTRLFDTKGASSLFDSLARLKYLENLKLLNDVFPPSEGKLDGIPQSNKFPPSLKKLTLGGTFLDWIHMATLGMLENLVILELKENAFNGPKWESNDGGFQSLKVLIIGRTDLVHWEASNHHFPKLTSLYLKHCSNLDRVPISLADVPSLQMIDLHCTTKSAVASAQEIENHKMQQEANQQTAKASEFKLSIYPPGHA